MPLSSTCRIASWTMRVLVEELVGFLVDQRLVGFAHGRAPALRPPAAEGLADHVAEIDRADRRARHAGNLEHRQPAAAARLHLDLDLLVVELVRAQLAAEALARRRARARADERVEHPLLGGEMRLRLDLPALLVLDEADADLDEVAHDLLDVAADIADLGELGRLDLEERRAGEARQAARDLGLAAAGRPDHQDVLRQNLLLHRTFELLAPPAVAQRDRDRALGIVLADDVAVELGDDLAGGEGVHCAPCGARRSISSTRWPSVSTASRSGTKPAFS